MPAKCPKGEGYIIPFRGPTTKRILSQIQHGYISSLNYDNDLLLTISISVVGYRGRCMPCSVAKTNYAILIETCVEDTKSAPFASSRASTFHFR